MSVIVTYSPARDLLEPESLAELKALRAELAELERVSSVTTTSRRRTISSTSVGIPCWRAGWSPSSAKSSIGP